MKLVKLVYLLAIGTALSLSSTGCRKGLDKTTQIPGRGARPVTGEMPAEPRTIGNESPFPIGTQPGLGQGNTGTGATQLPPVPETGYDATDLDFTTWTADAETFKDQTIYFDFDKSIVKASEVPKLEEVARRMKSDFVGKALRVEGHCDERGTEEYNRALGDRRALSIRESLIQLGLDAKYVPTISYGEERPAVQGHTEEAWKKNRRGELILLTRPGSN